MELIKPEVKQIIQQPGELGMMKHIEFAARLCYRSEDRITDTSHIKFINMLKANEHLSVLEHGTIYLVMDMKDFKFFEETVFNPRNLSLYTLGQVRYSLDTNKMYITTNYRRVIDRPYFPFDMFKVEYPTEYHDKRYSFLITTSRDISHQLVRHRVFTFSQESQRYCNYSKRGLQCIDDPTLEGSEFYDDYLKCIDEIEDVYNNLVKTVKPEAARKILANATVTRLFMTGTESQWEGFFKLRLDSHAQYDIREVAGNIKTLLENIKTNN